MKENEPTYLYLTKTFRIFRCDDRNFELEQHKTVVARPNRYIKERTETDKWVSLGYFSDLCYAVGRILSAYEEEISQKEKMTLEDFTMELKAIKDNLIASVKESGIQVTDFTKTEDGRGRKAGDVKVAKVKGNVDTKPERESKVATKKSKGRGRPRKLTNRS